MTVPIPNLNLNQNALSDAIGAGTNTPVTTGFGDIINNDGKPTLLTYALIAGGFLLWLKFRK